MKYFIITGTSRGLGEAMAMELINPNHYLICISRNNNENLEKVAEQKNGNISFHQFDFSEVGQIELLMKDVFYNIDFEAVEEIYLVNNAGVVAPIKPIDKADNNSIIQNVQVNLLAPMLLVSNFISNSVKLAVEKKIVNISSGAGRKPYYGWASYSSSKAGIDMFTQAVALEQKDRVNPVKIVSIAPGVVDTNMQNQIRTSNKEDFEQLDRFISLKEKGYLQSPEEAAQKIIKIIFANDYENGALLDIRTYFEE